MGEMLSLMMVLLRSISFSVLLFEDFTVTYHDFWLNLSLISSSSNPLSSYHFFLLTAYVLKKKKKKLDSSWCCLYACLYVGVGCLAFSIAVRKGSNWQSAHKSIIDTTQQWQQYGRLSPRTNTCLRKSPEMSEKNFFQFSFPQ